MTATEQFARYEHALSVLSEAAATVRDVLQGMVDRIRLAWQGLVRVLRAAGWPWALDPKHHPIPRHVRLERRQRRRQLRAYARRPR